MFSKASTALVILISVFLVGCESEYRISNNSSQGDNDYFEEPISDRSEKYSQALNVSNQFVERFVNGELEAVHELMDPRLREKAPIETLQEMRETVVSNFGRMVEFKPMQWGFATHSSFENVVISVKIVIHEKSEAFYVLKFEDDGRYSRIIGFNNWPRNAGASVSHAFDRFFDTD